MATYFESTRQVVSSIFRFSTSDRKIILCRAHFQDSITSEFREQLTMIGPSSKKFSREAFQIAFKIFSLRHGKSTLKSHRRR